MCEALLVLSTLEEIYEVLYLRTALRRQALQLLEQFVVTRGKGDRFI